MTQRRPGVKVIADPAAMAGIEDRQYTTREVAELFEVSESQVRVWIRSHKLIASKNSRTEGFRIPRSSLVQFALKRYSA